MKLSTPLHSYTFGTTPVEVIKEALPHKYDLSLNRSDMMTLLTALFDSFQDHSIDAGQSINAFSLRTSILETIGIEEL